MSTRKPRTRADFLRECDEFATRLEAFAKEVRAGEWISLDVQEYADRDGMSATAVHTIDVHMYGKRTRL